MTSCENFLTGGDIKQEITDAIAYNNAKEISILIKPEEGTGSTVPSGNFTVKQGYAFEVSFSENPAYSFVKWIAVAKDNPSQIITSGVSFEDDTTPDTKVKISNDSSIRLIPFCEQRIAVSGEPSPRYDPLGVSRDRSISVSFTKTLSEASFIFDKSEVPEGASVKKDEDEKIWAYTLNGETFFKNISITNIDDYSIADHFLKPVVNGKLLTITVDKTNPIEFNAGELFKTVKVTLSADITDTAGIKMNAAKSWNYQITESTDEKATVILTSAAAEGSVYLAGTKAYSLGQKITLAFTENADYQFVKWDYDSDIIYVEDPKLLNTTAVVREKTTEENPTQIKAVCAPHLRVAENGFSPVNDSANPTVSKNSSIIITFSHNLPVDEEGFKQLENITIAVGGSPVKSSFKAPAINENTITFAADNSNMLDVPAGQSKTVSVSIPSDFYYQLEDGTKITYGGNGRTFDYKIDDTTTQKTTVTFTLTNNSGTISPAAGISKYSIGQEVPIIFTPENSWKFISWSILKDNAPVDESKIKIADRTSPNTKLTIYEAMEGVTVKANASKILSVTATSPSADNNSKNSAITIVFNNNLDSSCKDLLDQIKITMDTVNVDSYFTDRKLSGNKITISQNPEKYLNVTGTEKKTVTVTLPVTLFYTDTAVNSKNYLPKEYSFSYVVDSTTDKKTNITYDVSTPASGTINQGSSKDYDIGSVVNLSFNLADEYQFNGWQITDENGNEPAESIIKIADKTALATTMTVFQYAQGISVKANASKKFKLESHTPTASQNVKDSDITITFNKNLASDSAEEKTVLLNSIRVSMDGNSVDNYFATRDYNANTITLTNTKYLPVTDGLQKTVTVTVPTSFYYKDGSVKVKLEKAETFNYVIDSSSKAKAIIGVEASENTGTVSHSPAAGSEGYSLGKEITISFTPDNNCEFTGWTVTSGEVPVPESKIKIEDPSKSSTKLYIYESVSNVKVKANAKLLPVVSKFEPSYDSSGKECDSPVEVTFNKPMNTDTFKLYSDTSAEGRKGTIQIVNPSNEYEHYEEYFNEPSWSADGKTLTLKTKNTIYNSLVKNESDLKNIRVVFDISKVTDTDGNKLKEADAAWVYRINHNTEKIDPTVEMMLYKRGFDIQKNSSGEYAAVENSTYTELSNKVFDVTKEKTKEFSNASDYSLNHVGKKIYFDATATDSDSGYKQLTIQETLIKTVDGTDVEQKGTPKVLSETSFSKCMYELQSQFDGVIQLDFVFEDYAGNKTTIPYYVIKDTTLDSATVLNPKMFNSLSRIAQGNSITETLDYSSNGDTFYSNKNEKCSYRLIWGYDDNYENSATPNSNNVFTFTRDVSRHCWLCISAFDSVGNIKTIKRVIPKQFEVLRLPNAGAVIYNKEEKSFNSFASALPATVCRQAFVTYQENENSTESVIQSVDMNAPYTCFYPPNKNGIIRIYLSMGLSYTESTKYFGPLSKPFVYYRNYTPSTSTTETAPEFPDSFEIKKEAKPQKNVGYVNVQVIPGSFIQSEGYSYGVCLERQSYSDEYETFNFGFPSNEKRTVKIYAQNNTSGTIYKSTCSKELSTIDIDNVPPNINLSKNFTTLFSISRPNRIVSNAFISEKSGLFKNSNNEIEMEYYLSKKDDLTSYFNEITEKELQASGNKLYSIYENENINLNYDNFMESYYILTLNLRDAVGNNKLDSYVVTNRTFAELPRLADCSVEHQDEIEIEGEVIPAADYYKLQISLKNSIVANNSSVGNTCISNMGTDNTWKRISCTDSVNGKNITVTCYKDHVRSDFIELCIFTGSQYNPVSCSMYKYLDLEYELKSAAEKAACCKNKAVVPGLGGAYQVYYDAPCFAHTMAFPTDMLGDLDAKLAEAKSIDSTVDDETYIKAIWETKGREYGLKLINSEWLSSSSNTTYIAPVSEIPSGYSYVIVFHFADGTSVMSEVKQK